MKLPGCNRNDSIQKDYILEVPMYEKDGKTPLLSSTSSIGFSITYNVRCFVKHAALFEVATQGYAVNFPIFVFNKP